VEAAPYDEIASNVDRHSYALPRDGDDDSVAYDEITGDPSALSPSPSAGGTAGGFLNELPAFMRERLDALVAEDDADNSDDSHRGHSDRADLRSDSHRHSLAEVEPDYADALQLGIDIRASAPLYSQAQQEEDAIFGSVVSGDNESSSRPASWTTASSQPRSATLRPHPTTPAPYHTDHPTDHPLSTRLPQTGHQSSTMPSRPRSRGQYRSATMATSRPSSSSTPPTPPTPSSTRSSTSSATSPAVPANIQAIAQAMAKRGGTIVRQPATEPGRLHRISVTLPKPMRALSADPGSGRLHTHTIADRSAFNRRYRSDSSFLLASNSLDASSSSDPFSDPALHPGAVVTLRRGGKDVTLRRSSDAALRPGTAADFARPLSQLPRSPQSPSSPQSPGLPRAMRAFVLPSNPTAADKLRHTVRWSLNVQWTQAMEHGQHPEARLVQDHINLTTLEVLTSVRRVIASKDVSLGYHATYIYMYHLCQACHLHPSQLSPFSKHNALLACRR
jgi:hypothetical protein